MRGFRTLMVCLIAMFALSFAAPAFAQENYPPDIEGNNQGPGVLGTAEEEGPSTLGDSVLPFTGGDLVLFVVVGAGAIVLGATIVRRTRSRA